MEDEQTETKRKARRSADRLLEKIPSFKERMLRADAKLYDDCKETETNLIEEFSMKHFSQFMHRVSLPLNGDRETIVTPIVRDPTRDCLANPAEEIPEKGVTVNGESFTKYEVEMLIRCSQWRFTPHSEND